MTNQEKENILSTRDITGEMEFIDGFGHTHRAQFEDVNQDRPIPPFVVIKTSSDLPTVFDLNVKPVPSGMVLWQATQLGNDSEIISLTQKIPWENVKILRHAKSKITA